jgi:thiol-disulfide isomerase/thioredoxin
MCIKMQIKPEYVLIAILVFLVLSHYCQPYDDQRQYMTSGLTPAFTMYGVDWCGHCRRAKPEFQKLKDHYAVDGFRRVQVRSVDCEDPNGGKQEADLMGVRGFPAMYLHPEGTPDPAKAVMYKGPRTYSAMMAFVEQNL